MAIFKNIENYLNFFFSKVFIIRILIPEYYRGALFKTISLNKWFIVLLKFIINILRKWSSTKIRSICGFFEVENIDHMFEIWNSICTDILRPKKIDFFFTIPNIFLSWWNSVCLKIWSSIKKWKWHLWPCEI